MFIILPILVFIVHHTRWHNYGRDARVDHVSCVHKVKAYLYNNSRRWNLNGLNFHIGDAATGIDRGTVSYGRQSIMHVATLIPIRLFRIEIILHAPIECKTSCPAKILIVVLRSCGSAD